MRCKAHRPGDIKQCEQEAGHEGPHSLIVQRRTPVHEPNEKIKWTRYWEPAPMPEKVAKLFQQQAISNLHYGKLGIVA